MGADSQNQDLQPDEGESVLPLELASVAWLLGK